MAVQIQLRNDTAANWTSADPILAAGEIAVTITAAGVFVGMKIGNGTDEWSALPYMNFTTIEEYATLTIVTNAVTWDAATGLNKKLSAAADFTLTISNITNGMSGALTMDITAETTVTLSTGLTELGNGSLVDLAIGKYVFAFAYDGSVFYYNIALYE